jgi:hypothetical protein
VLRFVTVELYCLAGGKIRLIGALALAQVRQGQTEQTAAAKPKAHQNMLDLV